MKQKKCYVCDTPLTTENKTEEHIIINAIGGRLKSNILICRKCNSSFGEKIDSVLAKQLNYMTNILMVKRERGKPQPILAKIKATEDKIYIEVGGKPVLIQPTVNDEIDGTIKISAKDKSALKKAIKGQARKRLLNIDVEKALMSAEWSKSYCNEPLQATTVFGGEDFNRAICKSAVNYYIYKDGNPAEIKHLIPYINGSETKNSVVVFHYKDGLHNIDKDQCSHIIHLVGNKQQKILYCYIEYFNVYKQLVLLNENYNGNDVIETYSFDLINLCPTHINIDVEYDRNTLLNFFNAKEEIPLEDIKLAFAHKERLGSNRQHENHRLDLVDKALKDSLEKYPDGTIITEEIINEMTQEFMKQFTPYFLNNIKIK